jgi:Flp pilus assembly protein TadG
MRRFWSNRDGNFAMLFAIAAVPIIGAMGAAVDYSIANSYRTDMQKALDSTALALSKIMPADQATLDTVGMQYFTANMGPHSLSDLAIVVTPDIGQVKIRASGFYQPKIAHILGQEMFPLSTESTAKWSLGKVEVALVLDNSLSMNDLGRVTHLKAAAHDLLNVLQTAAKQPGDAKVAIVPFDGNVKVTPPPVTDAWITAATWLRWDLWQANNGTCTESGNNNQSACVSDGSCSKSKYTTKKNCESNGYAWTFGKWTPKAKTTWSGCVQDRDRMDGATAVDYDTKDTEPTSDPTRFPAWQCYSGNLTPLMGLSENWGTPGSNDVTTLHGKVNALTPSGYTNINIGLNWGFHVLSQTPVYTEGAAYGTANLTKYVILMTDGNNTRSRYEQSCPVPTGPCPTLDAQTALTCANVKAANIKLYTVRLIDGNATLLQNCATNPSMYYNVQDASQLSSVFSAIGAEIASLHLMK